MVVLWLCGQVRGRVTLLVVVVAGSILLLTHTRTALVAMVAGILVVGLSLIVAKARVRKSFAAAGVVVSIAIVTLSGVLTSWLARGEGAKQLTNLTGRTKVGGPQGLVGVAVCVTILLFLLVTAYFQARGVQRALALFLITYCLLASLPRSGSPTPRRISSKSRWQHPCSCPTLRAGSQDENRAGP